MLVTELENGRPLIYSGNGTGSHIFNVDGYRSDGYFHINFGWGCYLNGWYALTSIAPGGNDFTMSQGCVFGLKPTKQLLMTPKDGSREVKYETTSFV